MHRGIFLLLFVFYCLPSFTQDFAKDSLIVFPTFRVETAQKELKIDNARISFWKDENGLRTIETVSRPSFRQFFHPLQPSEELKPFQVYWIAFTLANEAHRDTQWILSLGKLTNAEVYLPDSEGKITLKEAGQFVNTSSKDVKTGRFNYVNVFLPARSELTVFIRLQNQVNFTPDPKLQLISKELWQDRNTQENLIQGFFHGLLGMMFLYNFLLFLRLGDRTYFFYLTYLLATSVYLLNFHGYWGEFVMGDFAVFNYLYMPFTGYLAFIFYLQFMRDYLRSKSTMPYWDVWIRFLMGFFIVMMGLMLVVATFDYQLYMKSEKYINSGIMGVLLMVILFILFQNNALSRYFVLGTVCMLLGTMALLLGSSSVFRIAHNVWWYQLGIVLELGLFSLGLSERYKFTEKEVQKAKQALIAQLQENHRMQAEANQVLEQKVKERTQEIEKKNEEILVQSEEIAAQRDLLELQKEDLEDKNKHITDSIIYASRIQTAIMDDYQEIEHQFKEAFIFYRPKDIVSGDFYWFAEVEAPPALAFKQQMAEVAFYGAQKSYFDAAPSRLDAPDLSQHRLPNAQNKLKIVIAADCTGHGVPGAFMTVMGNALLNEIVYEKKITEPAKILSELDKQVIATLSKQGAKRQLYDGMDISIVVFEESSQSLHFAGATNPLYRVRQGEIEIFKASKYSVGYSSYYKQKTFTQERIEVKEGDIFYLSSDGFQDQFGGKNEKKLMKKKFRELLLQLSVLPLVHQKEQLGIALDKWRGNYPQTDDILVVGIKF